MSLFDYLEIDLNKSWALKLNVGCKKLSYKFPDDQNIWAHHVSSFLKGFFSVLDNLTDFSVSLSSFRN